MHEASLAMNIIDIVTGEMKKYPGQKLKKIFVDIGDFTHIDAETLQFAYEVASKDENLAQSTLEISKIPLILSCKSCKKEFSGEEYIFTCPSCKSKEIEILKGREFRITELEVD
jgi:hydrogenase nickel incorporation protein HypA/HybF